MKQIDKKSDWSRFLSGIPSSDYIFQDVPYEEQIEKAAALIEEAESILIGAGAGASAAVGLTYSGKRFTDNFGEFIEKYGSMSLIRLNLDEAFVPESFGTRAIGIDGDMADSVSDLYSRIAEGTCLK